MKKVIGDFTWLCEAYFAYDIEAPVEQQERYKLGLYYELVNYIRSQGYRVYSEIDNPAITILTDRILDLYSIKIRDFNKQINPWFFPSYLLEPVPV